MLLCAEDLGTIPKVCPQTLKLLGIPGNDVQRWIKEWKVKHDFLPAAEYRTLSVAMLSTHDTTNWPAWWENEAGTIDEALFIRKCADRKINYASIREQLFDQSLSRHGRLRWRNDITSTDILVNILGKKKEELKDFIDLYENSFQEKEKLWKHLKLKGPMREGADAQIVEAVLKITLDSEAIFCIQLITDWLYLTEIFEGDPYQYRINTPGTISPNNWSLVMPISLEGLLKHKVCGKIKKMVAASGRK
jgi:4-alpha-glucanotransferase